MPFNQLYQKYRLIALALGLIIALFFFAYQKAEAHILDVEFHGTEWHQAEREYERRDNERAYERCQKDREDNKESSDRDREKADKYTRENSG